MEIGEKIRNRRMELGWSQRDLAAKMGYTNNSTIAKIELGQTDVTQSRVIQFSKVLNVPVSYLIDWDDEKKKPSPDNRTLTEKEFLWLDLFREFTPAEQEEALERLQNALQYRK